MAGTIADIPNDTLDVFRRGTVIPAHPLGWTRAASAR